MIIGCYDVIFMLWDDGFDNEELGRLRDRGGRKRVGSWREGCGISLKLGLFVGVGQGRDVAYG